MIQVLEFWVPGAPKTKGSMTARAPKCHCCAQCRGYARLPQLRDSEGSKRWRKLVAYQAKIEMKAQSLKTPAELSAVFPLEGPVIIELWFALPDQDVTATGVGDLDKLYRNVLDALGKSTPDDAGVYKDDVQVTQLSGWKASAPEEMMSPGVRIRIFSGNGGG